LTHKGPFTTLFNLERNIIYFTSKDFFFQAVLLSDMDNLNDLELIDKSLAGSAQAFATLVERHYLTVYRFAFKWCAIQEDAEDITQDVFVKLAGKLHTFNRQASFTTWLYRVTANCAKDFGRKRTAQGKESSSTQPVNSEIVSDNPGPENHVYQKTILAAINRLPEKLKEAVLLVFGEGCSHSEAAGIIGCAETTVSWRIFQARKKLKKVLS
jgi:RNA polymerase sigma-70 factor (ECF subfamily)